MRAERVLRFFQRWKCSFAASVSAATVALLKGALRIQEHATRSALHGAPCFRERVFSKHERGKSYRRIPKVGKFYCVIFKLS